MCKIYWVLGRIQYPFALSIRRECVTTHLYLDFIQRIQDVTQGYQNSPHVPILQERGKHRGALTFHDSEVNSIATEGLTDEMLVIVYVLTHCCWLMLKGGSTLI